MAAAWILSAHSCSVLEAPAGASSADVFSEARRLRPDIKVVVTSAYRHTKVDQCFPSMEIDAFIRKPYELSELAALMIAVLIRNKRAYPAEEEACASRLQDAHGNRTSKVDPAPRVLVTWIAPPCDRTIPCTVARPRPRPLALVV
jgi:DNA-binding NarL/FixJ family response regulator